MYDEIFQSVEHGFTDKKNNDNSKQSQGIWLKNFLECDDDDDEAGSTNDLGNIKNFKEKKKLRQAIVVRAFANKVKKITQPKGELFSQRICNFIHTILRFRVNYILK